VDAKIHDEGNGRRDATLVGQIVVALFGFDGNDGSCSALTRYVLFVNQCSILSAQITAPFFAAIIALCQNRQLTAFLGLRVKVNSRSILER
jgi:hypothetical protein